MQTSWYLVLTMAVLAFAAPTPNPGRFPYISSQDTHLYRLETKPNDTDNVVAADNDTSLVPMFEISSTRESLLSQG